MLPTCFSSMVAKITIRVMSGWSLLRKPEKICRSFVPSLVS